MHQSFRRVLVGSVFFLITLIVAVSGYMSVGWTPIEAVYMVTITVFGVGFGEVRPITSTSLRVFTILVIVAGYSSVAYTIGGFLQMLTEGEINRALDARRMSKEIGTLTQHVIICGYGRIGQILAKEMAQCHQRFVIVDSSSDRIAKAAEQGYLVLNGNAADEAVLQAAGIDRARFLATVLPDDATNVFITLTSRGLNSNLIILARGEFPSTEKKLRLAGADHVVLPATIGALRMAHMITHPAAVDYLDQNDGGSTLNELLSRFDIRIDELPVPAGSPLIGGTVGDIEVRGRGAFLVMAVRRADGSTVNPPTHETPIFEGDIVIVMGHQNDVPQFAQIFAAKRQLKYRGAKA